MTADGLSSVQTRHQVVPSIASRSDWRLLRAAILKSIATSPGAFLATADRLKDKPDEYWTDRLESATWAVVQRRGHVLGIAAAKPPDEVDDYYLDSQEHACFIESVWVDPGLRGRGVGERLVTYLIEQQRQAGIQDFYLWVIDNNEPAIRLYDRMDFKETPNRSALPETQYLKAFDSNLIDDEELNRNADARERDGRDFGITYRLLTAKPARSHLPLPERVPG